MKTEQDTASDSHKATRVKDKGFASIVVWMCRVFLGFTFIISGWAKAIDPWGFIYKIEDYLTVWHISEPREIILCGAIMLSAFEFVVGVCLLCGMLRRAALWSATALMAFMLPLTVYIALANPVSDCGCFGDFITVSNVATLLKNIVICLAIGILFWLGNKRVGSAYRPALQWIAITISTAYILSIALYGYNVQPMVDFRPYPVGTDLAAIMQQEESDTEGMTFIYSRDGQEQAFTLDELPDSSWTYVRRESDPMALMNRHGRGSGFGIYDSEGDDLAPELITDSGTLMLVVVADPGLHYLSRTRFVNEIAMTVKAGGGDIIGLVGAPWSDLVVWTDLALPDFDVYSADDTELKSLVRGDAAMVLLQDGKIVWKRTVSSLDADFNDLHSNLNSYLTLTAPDSPSHIINTSLLYVLAMLLCLPLNIIRRKPKVGVTNHPTADRKSAADGEAEEGQPDGRR